VAATPLASRAGLPTLRFPEAMRSRSLRGSHDEPSGFAYAGHSHGGPNVPPCEPPHPHRRRPDTGESAQVTRRDVSQEDDPVSGRCATHADRRINRIAAMTVAWLAGIAGAISVS